MNRASHVSSGLMDCKQHVSIGLRNQAFPRTQHLNVGGQVSCRARPGKKAESRQRNLRVAAVSSVEAQAAAAAEGNGRAPGPISDDVTGAKARLAQALATVDRGVTADEEQRSIIEEAQIDLESLGGGSTRLMQEGALDLLHGLWRLRYSNTSDVLSILRLPSLGPLPFPILQVGDIYQNFICKGEEDSGVLQNIVDWSVAGILEEKKGARFVVTADFTVRSNSSLLLVFQEAGVDSIQLSDLAQGLLAPAVLPRTQMSMEALQFIKGFQFSVPLQSASSPRQTAAGRYLLTYLDDTTLIGRANAPAGSFIFERVSS